MQHLRTISKSPAKAQSVTPGQILAILSELLAVIAGALVLKEGGGTS